MLQTPEFFVKIYGLISSSLLFTKNFRTCFYLWFIADFMFKKSNFRIFDQFLDPKKIPRYLNSTFKGSKSHKSLHNFLLLKNANIFDFSNVEMPFKCRKVELGGQKPQNFNLKSCKFRKLLQKTHFLVKYCALVGSCLLFTKNFHICF